jgi:HSP20 family protein
MKKRAKGIHDIVTPLYREKAFTTLPKVWSFSTKPKFRRYQRSIKKTLFIERVEDPKTDVLEKVDNLIVMAELPNVEKEDIHWETHGDIFSIFAQDRSRSKKYMKEVLLPFVVDEDNIKTRYRKGIFEIFLSRHKGERK